MGAGVNLPTQTTHGNVLRPAMLCKVITTNVDIVYISGKSINQIETGAFSERMLVRICSVCCFGGCYVFLGDPVHCLKNVMTTSPRFGRNKLFFPNALSHPDRRYKTWGKNLPQLQALGHVV
jgi:hypothetical protein